MIVGVTRHMLPHLSGVPHLHVNRPLDPIHKNPHIFETAYFFTNRPRMNELIHWFTVDGRLIRVEKMLFQKIRIRVDGASDTFATLETRRELESKYVPQLFLGSLRGTRRSAIGQFFPCP